MIRAYITLIVYHLYSKIFLLLFYLLRHLFPLFPQFFIIFLLVSAIFLLEQASK